MSILKNIFSNPTKEIVKSIGNTVDNLTTTDEEKLKLKNELSNIVINGLSEALRSRSEIVSSESKGMWIQRAWRPIMALSFGFIVVYSKFIAPAFGLPNSELEDNFWTLLELMIGGYVISRGIEKVAETVTKNVDISFIRKKKRKVK